jgi:D-beta-D-heptose 7-phosphate kinase/D-beta-D-heptose 1-phosphate adenosyltransferase
MVIYTTRKANKLLSEFKKAKILVIGDILLDNYIYVKPKKMSRETPSVVFEYVKNKAVGGGAKNLIANLEEFTSQVDFLGDMLPGVNNRIVCDNKLLFRYDFPPPYTKNLEVDHLIAQLKIYLLKGYKTLVVSDYGKGSVTKELIDRLIRFANINEDFNLIIDPYIGNAKWYGKKLKSRHKNIVLTPNEEEYLAGCNGGDYVIETLGDKGICVKRGKSETHIPAIKKELADATGAGDTVTAMISLCVDRGYDLTTAAKIANGVASIVVSKFGTATVSPEEFKNAHGKKGFSSK